MGIEGIAPSQEAAEPGVAADSLRSPLNAISFGDRRS